MNGHWTGQALTTTEIHYIATPLYRIENSRLNTVFRVGLHSVHKRVFRQSWFQSRWRSVEMQALPPRAGNRRDTLMNYEVAPPAGSSTLYYEKLSPLTSHGEICPLESKI